MSAHTPGPWSVTGVASGTFDRGFAVVSDGDPMHPVQLRAAIKKARGQ